jgi:protein involved in polysaccharide export with SLBB domain
MTGRDSVARQQGVAENYQVGCPDVLEIEAAGRDFSGKQAVGPDGRIDLGAYGRPRVEGRTTAQIASLIAEETGASPEEVQVRVSQYCSQQLFLFGQVVGWQRTVPYQGQETVLDLLQRTGGINRGAEPSDVYVVRAHLDDGKRPEVYRVDLQAIVLKHDHRTNLRLLPDDQVYVGETRQARVERLIPPWGRPLYRALSNTKAEPPDPQKLADTGKRFPRMAILRQGEPAAKKLKSDE